MTFRSVVLALAVAVLVVAPACDKRPAAAPVPTEAQLEAASVKVGAVTVDEVDRLLAGGACRAVDANGRGVRQREGVVPGAIILSHYKKYAPSELPADKATKLVFYCTNEDCGASHTAAARAVVAGYTDVAVMSAGIVGWKKAGKRAELL